MNPKLQNALRIVAIGGGAVIALGGAYALFTNKLGKQSIMPAVSIIVGISAFSYAINKGEIKVIPQV